MLVEAEKGLWWRFGAAFCSPPQKGGHFLGAATASFRDQNSITSSHLAGYTGKHSLHTSRRNRHRVWRRGSVGRAPHLPAADPRPVPSRLCSSVGKKKTSLPCPGREAAGQGSMTLTEPDAISSLARSFPRMRETNYRLFHAGLNQAGPLHNMFWKLHGSNGGGGAAERGLFGAAGTGMAL